MLRYAALHAQARREVDVGLRYADPDRTASVVRSGGGLRPAREHNSARHCESEKHHDG
jgi:hypothetical protein